MKKLKSVGQYFVALALAVVVSINSIVPAHAVTPELVLGAVSFMVSAVQFGYQVYQDATTAAERAEALSNIEAIIYEYWRTASQAPFDDSIAIRVDPDELADIAADLTLQGFPCEVVSYGYAMPSGNYKYVWVIQGAGHVYIPDVVDPDTSNGFGGRFSLRSHYFTHESQWLYAENTSSSTMLKNLYDKFSAFYDYIGDLTYLGFSAVNEGIELLDLRLQYLTGYITGFEDDPTVPSVMSKIDEVVTAIENISVVGGDDSRIVALVSQIATQLQQGGTIVSGEWQPTTIYDYIQGIYEGIGTGGGGGGTISDGSLIYNAIKNFQVDFDDTFSDLKQIYPVEKVEKIGNGSFEWNGGVDILNSVSASDKLSTTTIYRLPQTAMHVTENNGTFRIDNNGYPLPSAFNLTYDNALHSVSTYATNETKSVTGTDIIIRDAYSTTPLGLKVYGQSRQDGVPTAGNPVPVYGGIENGNPFVYMYKGSDDSYKWTIEADFESKGVRAALHGIPVDSGGNYIDENGQEWLCDVVDFNAGTYTKYVDSITFDGSSDEEWSYWNWKNPGFYSSQPFNGVQENTLTGYCDSFPFISSVQYTDSGTYGFCYGVTSTSLKLWAPIFCGTGFSSVDSFRSYLAKNPVTIYYACEPVVYEAFAVYGNGALDSAYTRINMGDFVNLPISITYTTGNPFTALYSDPNGNWYKERNDGTSVEITDSRVDILNAAFNYKEYDNAAGIKFNSGTNIINVSSGDLTIDYVKGSKFFNWLYLYLNNLNGGTVDMDALLDKLDDIEDALSNISGDVDIDNNLDIDIDSDNDSYNVFYVTDPDTGEDTSIVDLSGNALTAFGKLLNFLYQIGFGEALNSFGDTVDGLTDFYTGVGDGGADVWAS